MALDLAASALLARLAERYATARTYRDTGEQTSVHIEGPKPWQRRTSSRHFSTAFRRPDRFYFEFRDATVGPESEWARGAIWMNATGVHQWWTVADGAKESPPDLAHAIAVFTGVSGGTALFIPRLLGLIEAHSVLPLPETARVVRWEQLDGAECAIVEGPRSLGEVSRVWIRVSDAVLRREEYAVVFDESSRAESLRGARAELARAKSEGEDRAGLADAIAHLESRPAPRFRVETTTVWRPQLDVEVEESAFAFAPPASARSDAR